MPGTTLAEATPAELIQALIAHEGFSGVVLLPDETNIHTVSGRVTPDIDRARLAHILATATSLTERGGWPG